MDIYQALKKDHDGVKALLNQLIHLKDDDSEKRGELISQIRDELIPHSRAEEAVFYNSMRALDASKSLAMHGYKEHMEAEALLRSLQATGTIGAGWRATAEKLQETLEHHIREEEGEMFSAARQLFTSEEATAMAEAFEEMKPEIKEGGFMKSSMEMIANLMPPKLSDTFKNFHQGMK